MLSVSQKVRNRKGISEKKLLQYLFNNSKLGKFYLLPKVYKNLYEVHERYVISLKVC